MPGPRGPGMPGPYIFQQADAAVGSGQIDQGAAGSDDTFHVVLAEFAPHRDFEVGGDGRVGGPRHDVGVYLVRHVQGDPAIAGAHADIVGKVGRQAQFYAAVTGFQAHGPARREWREPGIDTGVRRVRFQGSVQPSARMWPFEVWALTSPAMSISSMELLLVWASRLPRRACTRISALEVWSRAGPLPSWVRMAPLEVKMRSTYAARGILMTKRAPMLPRRSEGRVTRMETESGLLSMATLSASAASWVLPDLEPLMSTVSWSQPETSTDPLKVSTESLPPDFRG